MAEPKGWFTANGQRIPIMDGETTDQALRRFTTEKRDEVITSHKKTKQTPIDYIKDQTFGKLDISKYHEKQFDAKGYITLDWKRMSKTDKQTILNINQNTNRLDIQDYGDWGKWVKLKKKN